jgi:hypothetical protein
VEEGYLLIYQGTLLDDIVWFFNADWLGGFAKLYSNDTARAKALIIPQDANLYAMQNTGYPTIYQTGTATYKIFGDPDYQPPNPAPIPCSLLLVGSGLGLIGWRRCKRG